MSLWKKNIEVSSSVWKDYCPFCTKFSILIITTYIIDLAYIFSIFPIKTYCL